MELLVPGEDSVPMVLRESLEHQDLLEKQDHLENLASQGIRERLGNQ